MFHEYGDNFTEICSEDPELCDQGVDKNYWALLLLVLCISVVFGNVLVILSVAKERSLQNITNYFIVSLAVADLCVAGVVMPFYAYTMVSVFLKAFSVICYRNKESSHFNQGFKGSNDFTRI